jgi:uncharacterized caspase-like protein
LALVLGLAVALLPAGLRAEERVALVIGNSGYDHVMPLDNPVRDAELVAGLLETMEFEVIRVIDADQITMKRAIARFGRALRKEGGDTVGLFYYAGHGVQSFGNNYLLPVDVEMANAADLDLVAVEAQSVLRQMASARNRTNIVILDACRNNPFEAVPGLNDNGLAEMKAPTGTFLAYATAPGAVALDGMGQNSPFTLALAEQIQVPGQPVEQAFKRVRRIVLDQSDGAQTPWDTSSLTSDFVFVAAPEEPQMSAAEAEELQVWRSVKAMNDPVQVMLFLRGYPDGRFAAEARTLLASLIEQELAPDTPADPVAEAAPAGPGEAEQQMFNAAQSEGSLDAYQAYVDAYPEGTFAEIARVEIATMMQAAAAVPAPEPEPEVAEEASSAAVQETAAEIGPITFASPLDVQMPELAGRTLGEIIGGSPAFPPVEGLPESYWKDQSCSACHQWTQERLCTQANVYLSLNMQRSLKKQHPYGGVLKQALKSWAAGGCQ